MLVKPPGFVQLRYIPILCVHTLWLSSTSVHKPGPKLSAHMSVQGICKTVSDLSPRTSL